MLPSLCAALSLISSLPFADGMHHMASVAPRRVDRRKEPVTPLLITNNCPETIWPGIRTQSGDGPAKQGFELQPGKTSNQTVSEDWQGRVWGRTNCTFNEDGTGPKEGSGRACKSGDCYGVLDCKVGGDVPVSLAEFTLDAGDGHTYYDISLVDGYNLPMAIVLQPLQNMSLEDIPPNLVHPSCQGTFGLLEQPGYDPYTSGHENFLRTNSSYPLDFDQKVNDKQVSRWCPWDLQQEPPEKPGDGVYPYPDDNIQRPAFNPCFSACAKNNRPEDCCTGEYNSPDVCKPGDYSKSVKKICPDAYSFAYDDQLSTFIIPSGAGFEVVFCPGARSTNILATNAEAMRQLAQDGRVSKEKNSQSAMSMKKIRADVVRRSDGMRSIRLDSTALMVTFFMAACTVPQTASSAPAKSQRPYLFVGVFCVCAVDCPRPASQLPSTSLSTSSSTSVAVIDIKHPSKTETMAQALNVHELSEGWSFKQADDTAADAWLSVARVPTNVHLDLIDHGKIPDPFLGFNELKAEWVADKTWTYKTKLPSVEASKDGVVHVLAFDGLDTFATVKLNGDVILKSDNMFIPHRIDVTKQLKPGSDNVLEIDFASARLEAIKIREAHPEHQWVGFNGDMSRLAVRKAQYHWGWDWGPILNTCGPWRPVRLETYQSRISDLRVDYKLSDNLQTVSGTITAKVEGVSGNSVAFEVRDGENAVFKETASVSDGVATVEFHVKEPKLWFPHGYGPQSLYKVTAVVSSADGVELHQSSRRTGFRKGELVQQPDEIGKTFYFRINNVDVFCGGSDWIPADSFTPRVTEERYRKWLEMMVDGYQVMIRIWGGGIWEENIFYDICDEIGVLVWQDFMFGCGNYPAFPEILKSIEQECTANVGRLRHHPSIAIYAGNNEDYQVQESYGLTYNYEDKDPENWLKTDFPARYIYEKVSCLKCIILPEVVEAESPHIPYHPGSPWGDGLKTSNKTVGDMHQWNVWHGTQEKYQIFDTLGGRFNSEFGMEAFPHIDTIKYYCTDPTQLYPQSHMLDFHNKADGHERRIATYLVENFRTQTDLEAFIHLTQLSQAEALMFGYRGWRRQWGQKRFCGGALVWQLNDCWPVTSWSIVDYFQRKKPAYYAMRRVLAPVAVAVKRAHFDWSVVHARVPPTSDFELWVASGKTEELTATVELRFISIATGKEIKDKVVKKDIRVVANGTTDVLSGTIDNVNEEPHVLAARIWVDGEIVSRDCDWPQPLKYLDFHDRGLEVEPRGDTILVRASKPTKGLVFEERAGVLVNDSAIDVVPGDEQVIKVRGLGANDAALKWTYLGKE
ncbi:glycoside hydrolase family 2 protein [Aaosphaeria arxii CBS 175.79]|uniref:Beta-mannosidase B n=1 Tax=Aaosphaeria arxii CBS 175.79 TaxID=1450172 RepID=A0A6A5XDD0_9PLEO|nr:glycoside hydrolase family 2 protein [Aaosphaeria arxii CBS 175.79]KAF2011012.1 glycoside hydrolase family 2 protein [Aaosphaeria arxii CBS 175.79]